MVQRIAIVFALLLIICESATVSHAISWDDAGNSLSKLWDDNGNWSPDGDPDSLDVFIGNFANASGDTTLVDRFYAIDSLTITGGADVVNSTDNGATNDFELIVNGDTIVSDAGSSIIIYGGDQDGLDTNSLTINSGASVILNSTTAQGTAVVEVDGGSGAANLNVNTGGTLIGTGRIDLESALGSPTTVLLNNGTITANTSSFFTFAPAIGTLQITADDAGARFDWDGGGNGVLQANGNQTLDIDVSPGLDGFGGTMNLSTGSTIDVAHAWELDAGTINANTGAFGLIIIGADPNPGPAAHIGGASWTMTGGSIVLADGWDSLQIDSQLTSTGGTIENSGNFIFNNTTTIGAGTDFQMNGAEASITVNDGATVNIDDANFNTDGSGFTTNVITVGDGALLDLDVDFALADEDIDGTVNLNGGELNITNTNGASADNNWRINSGATVNVNDAVNTADLDGGNLEIFGTVNVNVNADLLVNPTSTAFRGSAAINVAAGAELNVSGPSSYESGASITGDGSFSPGTATIGVDATDTEDATWATAYVNYDDGDHTINANSSLTIHADSIESEGSTDGIDNQTTIEGGGMATFNLTGAAAVKFDSGSAMIYNGNSTLDTFLGASSSPIEFHGTMHVNGDGQVEPRMEFDGATVNINDAGERLRLSGGSQTVGDTNTLNNTTINGPGTLQLDNNTAFRGTGTINAVIDDNGSADLIADGGLLTLGGSIVDIGRLGTSGAAAVLNVSNPWSTAATNQVILSKGRLEGATITNDGAGGIRGQGEVVAAVRNDTMIQADSGGTLLVDNNLNDWDGPSNGGTLRASGGTLELHDNTAFLFNGTVEATSGTVIASGFELEFDPGSMLRLSKGVYSSNRATDFGGNIEVLAGAPSVIQVAGASSTFENTALTTLHDTLRLEDGLSIVEVGATFVGGAALSNTASHELILEDGSNIGVLVHNRGLLSLGSGPGQSTVLDFQQDGIGVLGVELAGTGLNDYDRLTATALAELDGELELSLLGGFTPALNDNFTILSAAGGVNGAFSLFDFSAATLDPGLMWDVTYNATNVQLAVVEIPTFTADFDNDGDVDADDLAEWESDFGAVGSDADSDGDSDGGDFFDWQRQLGSGVAPLAALNASAVPEPSTLLLAGLAASCSLMMSRQKK